MILQALDERLHPEIQEKYDNSGTQVMFRGTDIAAIMISLDLDSAVLNEALNKGCGLIISHHPLFFKELKRIDTGDAGSELIVQLIDTRTSVYSAHTNLDKLLYDKLARAIGFNAVTPLFSGDTRSDGSLTGLGAMVSLEKPATLPDILTRVRHALKLDFITYTGESDKTVMRIAVLNGAGGGSIEKIIRETPVDCIITGDVGYHHAKYAADRGIAVLDAGHFGTEVILLGFLRERVIDCLTNGDPAADIPVYISESERNPFRIYGTGDE